jgi:phosphomannomutase/phosphoglucomutase
MKNCGERKYMPEKMPPTEMSSWEHMFRAYDIRGVYGEDLTLHFAEVMGKAFGTFIEGKRLAVGRDIRRGSPQLKRAAVKGLVSTGCEVVDLGIVTTPMLYFAIAHEKKDGGLMITASHNPAKWNGLKLCKENGLIVGQGSGIEEVKQIISRGKFAKAQKPRKVEIHRSMINEYTDFIMKKIRIEKKLSVVLDTGNSVPGLVAPLLFKRLLYKVKVINKRLDGTFPSRAPEPTEESLQGLVSKVKSAKADFGVGYDADGDRAVFVDDSGRVLRGDLAAVIFCQALVSKYKKVVYDVSCSSALEEAIIAEGGVPIVERVGRPFMMSRTLREKALFGAEVSGHFYFPEIYGLDDGTFTSLKMAEILSKSSRSLSQMINQIPKCFDKIINVPFPDEHKFAVIPRLKARFEKMGFRILDIDGVKAQEKDGWVLLRPSNTEPLIRIFGEGKTQAKLLQLLKLAQDLLKEEAEKIK